MVTTTQPSNGAGRRWTGPVRPVLFALVVGLLAACAGPRSYGIPMTRDRVVQDIDFAFAAFAEIHPKLYWRSDAGEIRQQRSALIAGLPTEPSGADAFVAVLRATSMINDSHVSVVDVPEPLRGAAGLYLGNEYAESDGGLPVQFDPGAAELRVTAVEPGVRDLKPGDVVTAINGVEARAVLSRLEALEPGSAVTKKRAARQEAGILLWLIGFKSPYRLAIAANGASPPRTVVVEGAVADVEAEPEQPAAIEYELLGNRVGLIKFHHMLESPREFLGRLSPLLYRIKRDDPRGLIIDVRDNPGGNMGLGQILLSFVNDKPFRPYSEVRWKVSQTCKNYFKAYDKEMREPAEFETYQKARVGETLIESIDSRTLAIPNFVTYSGPLALLIGPDTHSAAAVMADTMKTYDLGELFGQPTSEPANLYAEPCHTTLPNSQIQVGVPSALFIRANGDDKSLDPVFPDHLIADEPGGSDRVLDAAKRWIEGQVPGM